MKKLIVIGLILAMLLVPVSCTTPAPVPAPAPSLAIMVESNIVEAGSSFVVSGSNFKPHQKVWVYFEYRASDRKEGIGAYCEADEDGSIHPTIHISEDVVPDDYEVEISTGKNFNDRELIATLPIHIQAVK
ncbi:hypothetical protein ES703_66631 [subsurface metagenome]